MAKKTKTAEDRKQNGLELMITGLVMSMQDMLDRAAGNEDIQDPMYCTIARHCTVLGCDELFDELWPSDWQPDYRRVLDDRAGD